MSSNQNTKQYLELHVCMGLNACKGHDRHGTNDCAGQGVCATAAPHSCHTLNNCRGQGGCGLYGTAREQGVPGQNECAWQGSCAVPINSERISTDGPNQQKSVWLQARRLFEERMAKANRTFGKQPSSITVDGVTYNTEEGPPASWLDVDLKGYTACGSSGMSGGGSCI